VVTKVELTGERATLLGTLYGRALDAGSAQPILGDHWARDVVDQIEVDVKSTGLHSGDEQAVALRAKQLDDWAWEFLDRHTEAVVLHLGCGLDTRYFRLAPAPDVLWYDVDYPEVIALRSQLLPVADNVHPIGSSVTDLAWLDQVPADRPVLVVAEGLVMYLEELPGRELFRAIVERFPSGQLIFDSLSRFGVKMQRFNRAVARVKAQMHWGIDSVAELESIAHGLRCVTALSAFDLPGCTDLKPRYRLMVKLIRRIPRMRNLAIFYKLEF
jgi:O-methyltransferase involved in polyketide biosynthesis